jgi:hypothetical protein
MDEALRLFNASSRRSDERILESWKVLIEKCESNGTWNIDAPDAAWLVAAAHCEESEPGVSLGDSYLLKVLDHPGFCPPLAQDAHWVHGLWMQLSVIRLRNESPEAGLKILRFMLDQGIGLAYERSTSYIRAGLCAILSNITDDEPHEGCKSLFLRILDFDGQTVKFAEQVHAAATNEELLEVVTQTFIDSAYALNTSQS